MPKNKRSLLSWLGIGFIFASINAIIAPVSAQQIIIIDARGNYGVRQQPTVGSFIYGSPIPTPFPVNPETGLSRINRGTVMPCPGCYYGTNNVPHNTNFPHVLINPNIRDSVLVNPVIINNSRRRTSVTERSRVIITHPW